MRILSSTSPTRESANAAALAVSCTMAVRDGVTDRPADLPAEAVSYAVALPFCNLVLGRLSYPGCSVPVMAASVAMSPADEAADALALAVSCAAPADGGMADRPVQIVTVGCGGAATVWGRVEGDCRTPVVAFES